MLLVSQFTFLFIFQIGFCLLFICLPCLTNGQAVHIFPQFFIPGFFLFDLSAGGFATLALIKLSFRFLCLLNATRGGFLKTCLRCWSLEIIVRQCLLIELEIEGSLGSYFSANTGLFVFSSLLTFFNAWDLGIFRARSIAGSITLFG